MGTAQYRLEGDRATVYGSGSLDSLPGSSSLSSLTITRTGQTAQGDPVNVDLSSVMGQLRRDCVVTIQGGATASVGGGVLNIGLGSWLGSRVRLNGGRLVIRAGMANASSNAAITVGPQAGEIRIERQGQYSPFQVPVYFTDETGAYTQQPPPGFVLDFPNTQSVRAVYDPSANRTSIGDGAVLGGTNLGRTIIMGGDPFNLRQTGSVQKTFWGSVTGYEYDFTIQNGHYDGQSGVATCFLPGSLIRTRRGVVAVEDLAVGDEVAVFTPAGQPAGVRKVRWVGQGHVTVRPEEPEDEAGWPVRIRRDALADGVPCRDLLVTAEHCLLLAGHFIPVRMLVNGVSVFYDRSLPAYDYWHFEIEPHGIIEAEGTLTESYLDTGNRGGFLAWRGQAGESGSASWERDAAAPLGVDRALVEPLYRALQARGRGEAGQGHDERELLDDPALMVVSPSGAPLPLVRQTGRRYLFRFPHSCKEVTLLSRTSRPCDVIGPFVDDRRWLGVLVGRVLLFRESGELEAVTAFLDAPRSDGWDVQEATACRWTNGRAHLALPEAGQPDDPPLFLSVELLAGGPYFRQPGPGGGGHVRLGPAASPRAA